MKKKREIVLLVDAPPGAKKKHDRVPVEYNPNQHEPMVYPLLLHPEQIVYLRVKSSKVHRGNGTTSNPYELVAVLTAEEAEVHHIAQSVRAVGYVSATELSV